MIIKTYSIRIIPTAEQVKQLHQLSTIRADIWNTLINIQQTEYSTNKRIFSKYELTDMLPVLKNTSKPEWKQLNAKAIQTLSISVYSAYKSFFSLVKKDPSARPPGLIEDTNRFHTIVFNQSGWSFKTKEANTLMLNGMLFQYADGNQFEDIHKLHIKEVKLKNVRNKWLLDLAVETELKFDETLTLNNSILAIDLGLKTLATGIDTSGKLVIVSNKSYRKNRYFSKHINKVKSKQATTIKGSSRFSVLQKAKDTLYRKKNSQIKQTLHIQSKQLADMNYKTIVVGDLKVKELMSTTGNNAGFKKKSVRKSFNDSNVATFVTFLTRKCQSNNVAVLKINEAWTTKTNCLTGKLLEKELTLADREVQLSKSITIDRDLNAAINIYKRYEANHLALVNEPLDVSGVVNRYNLLKESSGHFDWKPICL